MLRAVLVQGTVDAWDAAQGTIITVAQVKPVDQHEAAACGACGE